MEEKLRPWPYYILPVVSGAQDYSFTQLYLAMWDTPKRGPHGPACTGHFGQVPPPPTTRHNQLRIHISALAGAGPDDGFFAGSNDPSITVESLLPHPSVVYLYPFFSVALPRKIALSIDVSLKRSYP